MVNGAGLYVGSCTESLGGEYHARLGLFPLNRVLARSNRETRRLAYCGAMVLHDAAGDQVETVGTVLSLTRFPLKSAQGEVLDEVHVGLDGLQDDRRWALRTGSGTAVTAKEAPQLRSVRARSLQGSLEVSVGHELPASWTDALHVLAEVVGDEVELEDTPGGHQMAPVHLVSRGAVDGPAGCDGAEDTRANVVLALAEPGAERSWLGRRLLLGSAELAVSRTPQHCLGVYCTVVTAGTVRVGDTARLGPPT